MEDVSLKGNPKLINSTIFIHIFCWLIFIINELGNLFYVTRRLEQPSVYICYYSINIAFFYCQLYLLDQFIDKSKTLYLRGVLSFLGLFLLQLVIKGFADCIFSDEQGGIWKQLVSAENHVIENVNRGLYFSMLSAFYWAAGYIGRYRRKVDEAERQQLLATQEKSTLEISLTESRNAYLQQQINPHLLFNTLNFVYSSVYKYSDKAARAVWLLAEIMRFNLEDTGPDGKVNMARELEQLYHLLEINRYRFNEDLFIQTSFLGNFDLYRVIPLVLLTLTENIFKHGNLREPESPAVLNISVDEFGKMFYYSKNLKKIKSRYSQNSKIGLQNLRIRLDYSYQQNYTLNILEDEKYFELSLTLSV